MPGILQLALKGGGILQPLQCREITVNISPNFFALIHPAEVSVFIETEIFGFGSPSYYCLVDFDLLEFIQAIEVFAWMTYNHEFIFICL